MARVRNVVAMLPGTASTGRVVLMAHYDSVQVSFGGNDDGAGVSTLLETARALTAGPRRGTTSSSCSPTRRRRACAGPRRSSASTRWPRTAGWCSTSSPAASSGPAVMFETSRGNADVVGVYGPPCRYPVATSFAVEVYRILPNDTDFTPFREPAGSPA